eukprot:4314-Alexandrium_andersonii.AAC.1
MQHRLFRVRSERRLGQHTLRRLCLLGSRAPIPKDCTDCGSEDRGLGLATLLLSRLRTPSIPAFVDRL